MIYLHEARSLCENLVISGKDVELNLDKWKPEKGKNVLFIIGLSGSGKTTLAEKYERENKDAYMFELDGITMGYDASNQGLLTKLYKYSPAYKELKDRMDKKEDIPHEEFDDLHGRSCKDLIQLMYTIPNKRFIVEGIQIYEFMNPKTLVNKPLIIKNTSMLESILRRFKRNANGGEIDWSKELKNELIPLLAWYAEENGLLDKFKRNLKEDFI